MSSSMNILTDAEKPKVFAIRELQNMVAENELTVRELRQRITRIENEIARKKAESSENSSNNSG